MMLPEPTRTAIRPDAELLAAARALLAALAAIADADGRIAFLQRVSRRLGDANYPVFIKLLSVVGESDDLAAKRLLAETLAAALRRGDVPSGSLTGWGSAGAWARAGEALPLSAFAHAAPRRRFDPVAYLTAWHSQTTNRVRLGEATFLTLLTGLLRLFEADLAGARIYQAKLMADILNQPEGTFAATTRRRLVEIARHLSPAD